MQHHNSRDGRPALQRLALLTSPFVPARPPVVRLLLGVVAVFALIAGAAPVAQGAPACAIQSTPCNLTDGLDDAQSLDPVAVAPDGRRVVFTHRDLNPPSELFSADIHGAERPIRLSPENEEASFVAISPDARRVLYMRSVPGGQELYSVPIAGPASARVRLAADLGPQPQVAVSPDGGKVVYAPAAANELRVVPSAGGQSRRLTDLFVPGGRAGSIRISADGDSVVYLSDQEADGMQQLYRVPLTLAPEPDPPTTRVNGPLAAGGDVDGFVLSAGGPAVYRADESTDNVRELYRAGLGGGARAKLSRPLPAGWEVRMPVEGDGIARVSADGGRVFYEIGDVVDVGGRVLVFRELYSVPIAGPAERSVRIDHPSLIPPGQVAEVRYELSSNGRHVLYQLGHQDLDLQYLLSGPAAGPADAGQLLTFPTRDDFVAEISRDSRRVAHLFPSNDPGFTNLFSLPIEGGQGVQLNGAENVGGFLRAGAGRFVYSAKVGLRRALFSVAQDGDGPRRDLTAPLGDQRLVVGRALTPNGRVVVYLAQANDDDAPLELYSSRLDPPAAQGSASTP